MVVIFILTRSSRLQGLDLNWLRPVFYWPSMYAWAVLQIACFLRNRVFDLPWLAKRSEHEVKPTVNQTRCLPSRQFRISLRQREKDLSIWSVWVLASVFMTKRNDVSDYICMCVWMCVCADGVCPYLLVFVCVCLRVEFLETN